MQNTSTTNAELVNSNSINCTQPMTVRLLPGVPLLAGPFYTNPLFPCFEQMRHASPNVSVADLLLPTPPSGPPPPPPPAMDKLFSMQQSYFLS
ncbi:unnamed protein product [Echinostoma caproni]|uniref:Uncharacterized protein n=1 Tax=Echinostoma caproni TaxID=27848 RepID=A0A183AL63_9TREM|nr:unnamed protein product [Echinostoma caproni]